MTAFVRREAQGELAHLTWEVRSVNHRYLEVSMRLPEEMRSAESQFRATLQATLGRGRIDATLRHQAPESDSHQPALNLEMVSRLDGWAKTIQSLVPGTAGLTTADVLRWPGVMMPHTTDEEILSTLANDLLKSAVADLIVQRQREGEQLAQVIGEKVTAARSIVETVQLKVPELEQIQRQRLIDRVAEFREQMESGRFEQELVLLLARADVVEEIDRLRVHLQEVERVLGQPGPVGRRLDFLMQELNREANTLGSKSNHTTTTNASVDLKVLIEQMREQVQNIE
ncbi:MAG: YicC/YloC family endoribonuclease [Pseudomonadota bacterium]|nr:YicC/YloC family endoribonuclease [Pseudomonadota bacterium]